MTTPTVTPEEMISRLDAEFQHCAVSYGLNIGDASRRRDAEVFAAARDFIRDRAAQESKVAASAEDALDAWRKDHVGKRCVIGHDAVHSEKCVETAFTDGLAAGLAAKERA